MYLRSKVKSKRNTSSDEDGDDEGVMVIMSSQEV